ncbi:MAG TPA: methyltransferase domain-containing protein [Actinomycetota bacterium]|nr:methyltransferase domain-containing protein [Actinomycetota bacterium]
MSDRSNVREQILHYERMAAKFDRSIWSLGNRDNRNHLVKVRAIADAIGAERGGHVLEVGTGTGLHARWLLENTPARVTALDASEPMLGIASQRLADHGGRVALGIADAHDLPFGDGTFDSAFCSGTLHHLSSPGRGIAELARVTRPGGRVAAMEPNWKFPSTMLVGASNKAERNVFKISPASLEAWARAAGLEDVRLRRLLYTPPAPRSWERGWDAVDRTVARIPGLKRWSIMLLLTGRVSG